MAHIGRFRLLTAALASAAVFSACDRTGPTQLPQTVQLRIVNAAQGTADIEVIQLANANPIATLDFGETTTQCVTVQPGPTAFSFRTGGGDLGTTMGTLAPGGRYSLFLVGTGATGPRRAVLTSDVHTVAAGNSGLRLINATSTEGDVYVTAPGVSPTAATRVAGNIGPLAMSNQEFTELIQRPAEHTRVRLFDVGATADARADVTLAGLPASRIATVVFTESGATAGDRAFLVFPCP